MGIQFLLQEEDELSFIPWACREHSSLDGLDWSCCEYLYRYCRRLLSTTLSTEASVKGCSSCHLLVFVLWLWLLVIAGVALSYAYKRGDGRLITELNDAFWFSFISITTVDFGDIYIPHSLFLPRDMFYLPLFLLVGFVFLANFLLKLSNVLRKYLPQDHLEDTLKLSREETEAAAATSDVTDGDEVFNILTVTNDASDRATEAKHRWKRGGSGFIVIDSPENSTLIEP